MEASSYPPSGPNNPPAGGVGASKFLADLPSRGLFSSTVLSPNPGGMRVYICNHNTSPPENQVIKTNSMNILIRSLMLKKHKGDSSTKDPKSAAVNEGVRKRAAERDLDGRASAKRAVTSSHAGTRQERSKSCAYGKDLHGLTVEKLRGMLRERGLSMKGKKDELIARLKGSDGQA